MFVSPELTYIQMQKTGCTHIAALLATLFDGAQIGKHNAPATDDIRDDHYYVSSVRNPWDWYLSLWTFGVQGGGGLRQRLTRRSPQQALAMFRRHPRQALTVLKHELTKPTGPWCAVYTSAEDVMAFRTWLTMMLSPDYAEALGEGFHRSAISQYVGFMTYRYCYLCCKHHESLGEAQFTHFSTIQEYIDSNCFVNFFIRQEHLEQDICNAVQHVRPLTAEEQQHIVSARKTNTSSRALSLEDYYDQKSINLVYEKERYLIEKFNYQPPVTAH